MLRYGIFLSAFCCFLLGADDLRVLGSDEEEAGPAKLSYLALGDSYTIGESVKTMRRWPVQLAKRLRKKGIALAPPEIIAETGWTTDELAEAIEKADPKSNRDLVSLLIGVNNQYRGRPLDEYQREFEALLKRAIEFARQDPQHVIVVSIPDYGLTPFIATKPDRDPEVIAKELDAYNQAAKEITRRYKAHWVDITEVSRKHGQEKKMLADDGLHPSGQMYGLWADEVVPVAQKILQESSAKSPAK